MTPWEGPQYRPMQDAAGELEIGPPINSAKRQKPQTELHTRKQRQNPVIASCWRNLRFQPKTAFLRFPPVHMAVPEGALRVRFGTFAEPAANGRCLRTPAVHGSVIRTAYPVITGGPDRNALIRIRDRQAAHAEGPGARPDGVFVRIYTIAVSLRYGRPESQCDHHVALARARMTRRIVVAQLQFYGGVLALCWQ